MSKHTDHTSDLWYLYAKVQCDVLAMQSFINKVDMQSSKRNSYRNASSSIILSMTKWKSAFQLGSFPHHSCDTPTHKGNINTHLRANSQFLVSQNIHMRRALVFSLYGRFSFFRSFSLSFILSRSHSLFFAFG